MKNLRQYGIAVMTLSDVVDDFCLAQGNMRQNAILAQYRHARWAWKELFKTTLWNIRKAVLCVGKNHTINLPDDCERLLNISVVDCYGKLHPLGFNSDWNTAKIKCLNSQCSCNNCKGQDTLCGAIDSIKVVTETVDINGTGYTKTTMTRYDGAGGVQTQTEIPVWDVASSSVVFNTLVETICQVETTTNGCIKATKPNMDILRSSCGCGNFLDEWHALGFNWGNYNLNRELIPAPYNYWGEWNFNAADPSIVHIFGTATQGPHFNHTAEEESEWRGNIRQVILDYQTNGETPGTEILVPEYAVLAMQVGMVHMQKMLNPKIGESEKYQAKMAFEAAKISVAKYLNPISLENFAKLQTNKRLW